jgi:hypothetical protein
VKAVKQSSKKIGKNYVEKKQIFNFDFAKFVSDKLLGRVQEQRPVLRSPAEGGRQVAA